MKRLRAPPSPKTDRTTLPRLRYHWTPADVANMGADSFRIWFAVTVVPAIESGRTACPPPNGTISGSNEIMEAAKQRAAELDIPIPRPKATRAKTITINAPKLAAALKQKAGSSTLLRIEVETSLDRATLSPIFRGQRKALHPHTLAAVCTWLGRKPVEFEL